MSNLQMIEGLCSLCEELARLVRVLAEHLAQLGDTSMTDEIAAADARYRAVLGMTPDESNMCPGPSEGGPGRVYPSEERR